MKRIAVMSSGGDAAGMNSALRAVVRCATRKGVEVLGIQRGFRGLVDGDFIELDSSAVSGILQRGGTILHTFRHPEFEQEEIRGAAAEVFRRAQLDGLIVIGGDGSFRGGHCIDAEWGVPVIGIPATIDNDIPGTDHAIGYDTALNIAVDAVDKIRDTATSHERVFAIEVMGRNSGMLAAATGLCCGAEEVLVPEIAFDYDEICRCIERGYDRGKQRAIIVVAEGAAKAGQVGDEISSRLTHEVRVAVLGHIQRGGAPSAFDRILAGRLGAAAVDRLIAGQRDSMVGLVADEIAQSPLVNEQDRARDTVMAMMQLHEELR